MLPMLDDNIETTLSDTSLSGSIQQWKICTRNTKAHWEREKHTEHEKLCVANAFFSQRTEKKRHKRGDDEWT